jgi:hypothetical protein
MTEPEIVALPPNTAMAPPHPTLRVKAADGVTWQVDLGNPSQT